MSSTAPELPVPAVQAPASQVPRVLGVVTLSAAVLLTAAAFFPRANVLSTVDGVAIAALGAAAWALALIVFRTGKVRPARTGTPRVSRLRLLLGAGTAWACCATVPMLLPAGSGLAAQYFANATFTGPPAQSVVDHVPATSQVRARWHDAPPVSFSVVWSGYITAPRAGRFGFTTRSDDGSSLHVDDQLVVDNGGLHGPSTVAGDIDLAEGPHRIILEYVQRGGGYDLGWSWTPPGGTSAAVPAWALSRRRAPVAAARAAQVVDRLRWMLAIAVGVIAVWIVIESGAPPLVGGVRQVWRRGARGYRSNLAFAASLVVWLALLFLPGGEGGLYRAVVETTGELHAAVFGGLRNLPLFRSNLNTPRAGERAVLPGAAVEVVAMLDAHGLSTYRLSPSMYGNNWLIQQVVASAWPRKLEPDAHALFIWNDDGIPAGCTLRDRATEVRLVACP